MPSSAWTTRRQCRLRFVSGFVQSSATLSASPSTTSASECHASSAAQAVPEPPPPQLPAGGQAPAQDAEVAAKASNKRTFEQVDGGSTTEPGGEDVDD